MSLKKIQMLESIVYPYILSMLEEKTETPTKQTLLCLSISRHYLRKDILNLSFDGYGLSITEEEQIKRMVESNMTIMVKSRMNAQISIEKEGMDERHPMEYGTWEIGR